jgi:glucose/arabinose dehydrogenase
MTLRWSLVVAGACVVPVTLAAQAAPRVRADVRCAADNGGITVPRGFCATVFADSLPGPRHLVVAPNGDVFVSLQGRGAGVPGGVMALRDRDRDGVAEERKKIGGDFRSSEVALFDGHLYAENTTAVLRFPMRAGELESSGDADTVVKDLPRGGHAFKTFALGRDGSLYVNVGSPSNACQQVDRTLESPGKDPCPELDTRAGIWRFDARKLGQTQATGEHFARGIRNAVAIVINPSDNALYVMQHGRDQLFDNWPKLFNDTVSAEVPGEEMFRVNRGDDFGWPYCYFDPQQKKKVLAPEYGGDGKKVERCASKQGNVAYFPGHWAPNGLLFYTGSMFPARYRQGAFVAFHGSWNRAPLPQGGFKVVFQPMRSGRASGDYEVFADGFATNLNVERGSGANVNRRPTGLAQGPDGALYVTDDVGGRIWKIVAKN